MGYSTAASIVFGLALAVASTVVLVRVLSDNRELHTSAGHIAVGWLVVEDLLTVIVLVLLPTLFVGTPTAGAIARNVAVTLLKVGALVAFAAVVGQRVIPALLDRVAATRSRELFTLTVLVIALGIAIGAAMLFGVSMALGAFLAGMVVARSDYSLRAATDALPMRDAFAVLFFVSIGMLLNPAQLLEEPWLVLAALGVVLIAKPLAAALILLAMRYPLRTILTVAVSLGQIGEFSFIMTALGRDLGILPASATEHRGGRVDHFDHAQPDHVETRGPARAADCGPYAPVAACAARRGDWMRPGLPRRSTRATARSSSGTGRRGGRSRGFCARTASLRPSSN